MKRKLLYNGKSIQRVYFVGIKGIAMASLASYFSDIGCRIHGVDVGGTYPSNEILAAKGIPSYLGFSKDHITEFLPDLVIYTGAHDGRDNPEVAEAIRRNIPSMSHGQALGFVMSGHRQCSVAGCHGKTTTSAMLAHLLVQDNRFPSYAIGCGMIGGLGVSGVSGKGQYFVAEADEYMTDPGHDRTPRFLWQCPEVLIITNIDYDHPDVYHDLDEVKSAYQQLVDKVPKNGYVILSGDDPESREIHTDAHCIRVGSMPHNEYRIVDIQFHDGFTTFGFDAAPDIVFTIHTAGYHNVTNSAEAAVAAHAIGVPWKTIQTGLLSFGGCARRFEKIGESKGVRYYDDYAHHPKEIQSTLKGARLWYPHARIVIVFQPHTYSRTKALLSRFAHAFEGATEVVICEIYASFRESDTLGITGETLADCVKSTGLSVSYAPTVRDVKYTVQRITRPGDIVIFMGAGDIYEWEKTIMHEVGYII